MPINKVDFAGQTLIDLTKDTVTAASLLKGITAHDKAGNPISGTASGPKPEQEKEITISENGDYPITPDVGKVLSKVLAKVNVSGGGGVGFDPAPFSRIEAKTWIPASDTNIYKVDDDPGNVLSIRIMFKSIIGFGGGITQLATLYKQTISGNESGKLGYAYQYNYRQPPASTVIDYGPRYDDFTGTGWFVGGYDPGTGELAVHDSGGADQTFSSGFEYAVIIAYGPLK